MNRPPTFILDANIFITAKNSYYGFTICPGFWESILKEHASGRCFSISRVRSELLAGRRDEDLRMWVEAKLPPSFFLEVDVLSVMERYTEIMMWSQRAERYGDEARAKFATGADGWLVAYAAVNDAVVVTNETTSPNSIRSIKLPDVCSQFGVETCNLFSMLRSLGVSFVLSPR